MSTNRMMMGVGDAGAAPIALDTTAFGSTTNGTTLDISITVGSGNAKLLAVFVLGHTSTLFSVQLDSTTNATSAFGPSGGGPTGYIQYFLAPASGAHTVNITWNASANIQAAVYSLFNIDQTNPVDASNGSSSNDTGPTTSITVASNGAFAADIAMSNLGRIFTNNFGQNTVYLDLTTGLNHGASGYTANRSTGAYAPTYSLNFAGTWTMLAASWKKV